MSTLSDKVNFSTKDESMKAKVFHDALIAAWICSKVLPLVSGTIFITNNMDSAFTAAYRTNVPEKQLKLTNVS